MNMVGNAADRNRFESVPACDTPEEGPESRLHLFPDKVAAFLGREAAMNQFTGIGVRHRFSPCLWDCFCVRPLPNAEALGYWHRSLRDKVRRKHAAVSDR